MKSFSAPRNCKPERKPTSKRPHLVAITMTEKMRQDVDAAAEARGLNRCEFLRSLIVKALYEGKDKQAA